MNKLSDKQLRAAELLAAGRLGCEVAEELGITPETVSHWKKQPVFEARYNLIREEIQFAALDSLRGITGLAVTTLADIMKTSKSEETRRRAAVNVLQLLGFDDPQRFHALIGSTDASEIESRQRQQILSRW